MLERFCHQRERNVPAYRTARFSSRLSCLNTFMSVEATSSSFSLSRAFFILPSFFSTWRQSIAKEMRQERCSVSFSWASKMPYEHEK